ncbi:MAG: SDR family NAD(P)-dependent oxidoreductase [Sphingobacteriales bacterium]|nr:SDR family NAD(P)-dependent oxidoreductase [Sphingobacteriales bacterium]OJY81051.1 MAG: 3-oxoacyl-ACP reductase [Sphingobacteriales bacterium 44-15]
MSSTSPETVLILGANSDVAKAAIPMYIARGYYVIAASRSTDALQAFALQQQLSSEKLLISYFDATDFDNHQQFYNDLPVKPSIVLYAAGFLVQNEEAIPDFEKTFTMMKVHYCGALSMLNIIVMDYENTRLRKIIGLSSLSGVRGRKSNFIYGSTKAAFTQYLAGLRQYLFPRKVTVNVIVAGYIRSKMTAGLGLTESLMLEPVFIAKAVVNAGSRFTIVPGFKWKIIYNMLRIMPEGLVAKLP